jgi:hypothetical protein
MQAKLTVIPPEKCPICGSDWWSINEHNNAYCGDCAEDWHDMTSSIKIQSVVEWSHIDQREPGCHYEYVETETSAYRLTVTNNSGIGYHWIVERGNACHWGLSRMAQVYFTDFESALEQGRTALYQKILWRNCP